MNSKNIKIDNVVFWEKRPSNYTGILPFTATIHHFDLDIHEKSIIQSALVNACHDIVRRRGGDNSTPFYHKINL